MILPHVSVSAQARMSSTSSSDYHDDYSMSQRRRQELCAAAGAAVLAVYQCVTVNPSAFFPADEEEDLYCPPSVYDNENILELETDLVHVAKAATLSTLEVVAEGEGKNELLERVLEEEEEVDAEDSGEVEIVKPGGSWFNTHLLDVWDEERWIRLMKMSRRTFLRLVEHLVPAFMRESFFTDVSVEKKVGATIFRLVNATDFLELGEKFAIDSYTLQVAIAQSVRAMNWRLNHLIAWPTGKDMEKVTQDFKLKTGLPNCCGALGICHIPIQSELPGYRNKKDRYSVILQAVCDSNRKFTDIGCGWLGGTRPTRVLRNSTFLARVNRKEVLYGPKVQINAGFWLRQYVIGDGRYPHLPWLLTPYDDDTLPYSKECFNSIHERCRTSIVRTFNTFQATFKLFAQPANHDIEFLPHLVFSACLLHNFLIQITEVGVEQTLMVRNTQEGEVGRFEDENFEESADSIRAELTELMRQQLKVWR